MANRILEPYNGLIADIYSMPDHSFPEVKPPGGFPLAAQSVVGFDQKPSFSSLVKPAQEPWNSSSWQALRHIHQPDVNSLLRPLTFHAEPLAPLRQRDEQALDDVFDDIQIEEMLADVYLRLKQLYPEPCWDDNSFDFLQGYL
jgi:hypothetical protein